MDMIWSIDIELDELVMESKSSEGTSGNEHQRNNEKDKQVVADLVKKLLVCVVFRSFVSHTEDSLAGRRNSPTRSMQREARQWPGFRRWT